MLLYIMLTYNSRGIMQPSKYSSLGVRAAATFSAVSLRGVVLCVYVYEGWDAAILERYGGHATGLGREEKSHVHRNNRSSNYFCSDINHSTRRKCHICQVWMGCTGPLVYCITLGK